MSMEQNKEHAFDAFCKRVVKNEAVNIQLEYSRQEQQEVVFSDLTPEEREPEGEPFPALREEEAYENCGPSER